MSAALAALKFLTIAGRLTTAPANPFLVGTGAAYFPLVGLLLGLILLVFNHLLEIYLAPEIIAVLLTAMLALMTGSSHVEGTKKTFNALSDSTHSRDESARSVEFYGTLAVFFLLLIKIGALEVAGHGHRSGLVLTPLLARWALVVFLCGAFTAADELVQSITEQVNGWHLLIATAVTLLLAILFAGLPGLWVALCVSLLALLCRAYFRHYCGGYTYDHLGAVVECSETLGFVLFASL